MAAVYAGAQLEPAPIVRTAISILPFLTCAWWVWTDARAHRLAFVQDWGLFAWIAWPLLVPWYAWHTRGRAGWRLAIGLYAAIVAPYLASAIGLAYSLGPAE
jgi:hypothetical protein